jgi:Aerotolerance regulator N-terminal/von Willebrand factor type A domain
VSFAQPFALLGLLCVPLIIAFYLWRARHLRHVVSSTFLWTEALAQFSHRPSRRLPLRDPLLLLQILAVVLLTMLFAGPRLTERLHVHQIVVLDSSVAMSATDVRPSRFVQAERQVVTMINRLAPGDTLSLILTGARAQLLGEIPGNSNLVEAISHLNPSSGKPDIVGSMALVRGAASESGQGVPRVTYVLAPETPLPYSVDVPTTVDRIGADPLDDQSIDTLTVRCPPGGNVCTAFARVRNMSTEARADDLAVWVDGQSLGKQTLHLAARGSSELTFAVPPQAHTVKAALLRHDAVPVDDSATAIVPAPVQLSALFVSDDPGQTLHALQEIPGLSVHMSTTAAFQLNDSQQYDLLILDNVAPDALPSIPTLAINPPATTSMLSVAAANTFLPVDTIDTADPLVQGLVLYPLASTGERIAVPDWAHVVVGGRNGPLLMDGVWNGARFGVFSFDVGHSVFAQDRAFPVLMSRLIHWLVPWPPAAVDAGDPVWLPNDVAAVRDPSGVVRTGPVVVASEPGIYSVASGTGARVLGEPLFAARASSPGDVMIGQLEGAPRIAVPHTGTFHLDLWPIALIIALVSLCGEWWFYAKKT